VAHYRATVPSKLPAEEVFALMADFANAEHWDPATVSSTRLNQLPVGPGAKFRLTMEIFGRENDIEYEIVEYEAPARVVLRGENSGSVSIDEITVERDGTGSAVTYDAVVTMKGAFKVIGPIFGPVFKRMGDDAKEQIGPWLDSHTSES
jgi:uncharacterized protein YndB with AHSA1/START domain